MPLPPPRRPALTLDSLRFDTSRYTLHGDVEGSRVWFTEAGDGLQLIYFPLKPDLPKGISSIQQLRDIYQKTRRPEVRLVDCELILAGGLHCLWRIVRAPDPQSSGSIYLGSLTVPFTEFSFVIKLQAAERGPTGFRDAVVTDRALANGSAVLEGNRLIFRGPSPDDAQFDDSFPEHPVSRVRLELRAIAGTLTADPLVLACPAFPLPMLKAPES